MTSLDLGSAFTACPDNTPKRLQVWLSGPITCVCLTRSELQACTLRSSLSSDQTELSQMLGNVIRFAGHG